MTEEERDFNLPEQPEASGEVQGSEEVTPAGTDAEQVTPASGEMPGESKAEGEPLYTPPPVRQEEAFQEVTGDDRLMAMLAWASLAVFQIPLISLVLLISEENKHRRFQRYHSITSIIFWGVAFLYEMLAAFAYTILSAISLGLLACVLWPIFFLPHVVALYYAYQAYQGRKMDIPWISDLARNQGWI